MSNNQNTETFSHQYSEDNITWFDCNKSDSEGYAELGYIIRPKPILDVVENKETVEQAAEKHIEQFYAHLTGDNTGRVRAMDGDKRIFIAGANWQQSQSIEGIVGFVLEYVSNQGIDLGGIDNMKSDIIKELKNG